MEGVKWIWKLDFYEGALVKVDGTVWDFTDPHSMVQIPLSVPGVLAVVGAPAQHRGFTALTTGGSVWAPTCTGPTSPVVQVPGLAGVVAIGGTNYYDSTRRPAVALKADGTLWQVRFVSGCKELQSVQIGDGFKAVSRTGTSATKTDGTLWSINAADGPSTLSKIEAPTGEDYLLEEEIYLPR
jgi:hypothetical protein